MGIFRAMLDTGAQPNLVSHSAIKHFLSSASNMSGNVVGISNQPVRIRKKLNIQFLPWFVPNNIPKVQSEFVVLPKAVEWEPIYPQNDVPCNALINDLKAPLADPLFWKPKVTKLIFGVQLWATIVGGYTHRLDDSLVSQETMIGNVIYGRAGDSKIEHSSESPQMKICTVNTSELDKLIQKFWEFEDLSLCTKENPEHDLVEKRFMETHYKDKNGRFVVSMPLKPTITELGSSREIALKRFLWLEKRLQKDSAFREKYVEFMREYEQLGHMIEAKEPPSPGEMLLYTTPWIDFIKEVSGCF